MERLELIVRFSISVWLIHGGVIWYRETERLMDGALISHSS